MKTRSFFARAIAVLLVVAMATALAACGGGAKSTPKPQATAAPTATPAPTNTPTPEPQPTQAETTELDSLISHLKLLAPVRVVSTFTAKEGDNPESVTRTEAEIDAAGNQRVRLYEGENLTAEFLFVDKQMYMGTGENQYVALGPQDDPWEALMLYGGAFLLVFNNLQEAEFVGKEQVNGFNTNKYRVKIDLSQFGLGGFIAGQQGAVVDYEGFAWVEMNAKALVKAETLYRAKSTTDEKVTEMRTEFDAVKADVAPIETPTNVIGQ
ncbi:MAG: LppX_LprAFG lipoprotein [Chloroflexi bacterium]|nr:LppX_LprAFG lipoprotein [Chloroflexota bacterium]